MNKLAKAIHVDSSLVNRWVNEKRIPPHGSFYIEKISDYLANCIVNIYQIELLEKMFSQLEVSDKLIDMSNAEKIRELLYHSLNYSKQCLEISNNKCSDTSINKYSLFPSNITSDLSQTNSIDGIGLSSNDQVIYGISKIYSSIISLIETATMKKNKTNNIIYLTYYSNPDYSFFTETRINHFRNMLLKAIDSGWNILYLLRLDDNKERLLRLIHFLLPMIHTGKINLYYLNPYANCSIAKEMCVVSGIGALSCYPSNQNATINCGFYLKNKSAINLFTDYLNILLRDNAQNLIKYYPEVSNKEYHFTISKVKQNAGSTYYYNWYFSFFLIPEKIYEKLLSKTPLTKEVQQLSLDNYKIQLSEFIENMQRHSCTMIYLSEFIENLIHHHTLSLYTYSGVETVPLEPIEIIKFLENIIHFILSYDNLHVGIIFHDDGHLRHNDFSHLFIKERRAVFLNIYDPSITAFKVRLLIKESMITKGVVEYFKSYWEQIAPVNKNKSEIVAWLQSCIDILKKINNL